MQHFCARLHVLPAPRRAKKEAMCFQVLPDAPANTPPYIPNCCPCGRCNEPTASTLQTPPASHCLLKHTQEMYQPCASHLAGRPPTKQREPARLLEHMAPVPTIGKVMCHVVGIPTNHQTLQPNEISPLHSRTLQQHKTSKHCQSTRAVAANLSLETSNTAWAGCLPCATVRKPSSRIHAVNNQTATHSNSPFCAGANNAGLPEEPAPATKRPLSFFVRPG